jgi:hypothetical protein
MIAYVSEHKKSFRWRKYKEGELRNYYGFIYPAGVIVKELLMAAINTL